MQNRHQNTVKFGDTVYRQKWYRQKSKYRQPFKKYRCFAIPSDLVPSKNTVPRTLKLFTTRRFCGRSPIIISILLYYPLCWRLQSSQQSSGLPNSLLLVAAFVTTHTRLESFIRGRKARQEGRILLNSCRDDGDKLAHTFPGLHGGQRQRDRLLLFRLPSDNSR